MARKTEGSTFEDTVLCACGLSSKVKVGTDRGWENLCMGCYYKHHFQQSLNYCSALKLNTTAERIAWLRKHAKGLTKRYTKHIPVTREPGQDWEEDAA
jgi:hypothetical protein